MEGNRIKGIDPLNYKRKSVMWSDYISHLSKSQLPYNKGSTTELIQGFRNYWTRQWKLVNWDRWLTPNKTKTKFTEYYKLKFPPLPVWGKTIEILSNDTLVSILSYSRNNGLTRISVWTWRMLIGSSRFQENLVKNQTEIQQNNQIRTQRRAKRDYFEFGGTRKARGIGFSLPFPLARFQMPRNQGDSYKKKCDKC